MTQISYNTPTWDVSGLNRDDPDAVWCHSDAVQCATYLLPESCQYQSNLQLKNVYFTAIGYLVDRSSTLVGILQDDFLLSNGLCLACVVEPAATQLLP